MTATSTSKPVFAMDYYDVDANGGDGEWCLATHDFDISIVLAWGGEEESWHNLIHSGRKSVPQPS